MGTCYSGFGNKSPLGQRPFDPKDKTTVGLNGSKFEDKVKAIRESDFSQLSSSFENLSYSPSNDYDLKMSSQPIRNKIPVPSSRSTAPNKVVPKRSEEVVLNKYQTRRYDASVDVNKVMIFDNSSTTSISSDCSLNLSKSSLKSSSSSVSNSGRTQTSIPKVSNAAKSRTPTPPVPIAYNASNQRNKLKKNTSSMSDRLNGNASYKSDDKNLVKTKTVNSNESSVTRQVREPYYGSSIKYTTQMSGLPRPQTAHIVSTSSHNSDNINHKKPSNDIPNRVNHYSEQMSSNSRCDPNLRQVKPYFYGMNINNKPYERPFPSNANSNQLPANPAANQPKLQFSSKFSQNINQKHNLKSPQNTTNSTNGYQNSENREKTLNQNILNNNINQNQKTFKQIDKTEPKNNNIAIRRSFENQILPQSIQKMKELDQRFKREPNFISKDKSVDNSPEHNSISSVGANSEDNNRDFLIDDEISDQPELVLSSNVNNKDLVKNLNLELEGLLSKQENSTSPPTPTAIASPISTTSSTSTVMSNTTFRKPRPLSLVEMPDGSLGLDSPSLRAASQDLIGIKTLLFRLHGLLQNAETLNPFEHNYSQNKLYHQLITENDDNTKDISVDLQTENLDLKRQIVLQQQIIEDKDRTIRLLQQQMAKYSDINNAYLPQTINPDKVNASSQTDRCRNASNIDPRAMSDGSNGTIVSVCCSHPAEPTDELLDPK